MVSLEHVLRVLLTRRLRNERMISILSNAPTPFITTVAVSLNGDQHRQDASRAAKVKINYDHLRHVFHIWRVLN